MEFSEGCYAILSFRSPTLQGFLTFLNALNAESLTDSEMDLLSDISIRIIELEPVSA